MTVEVVGMVVFKLIKSFPITPEIWRPYRTVWFCKKAIIVVNQ